jgi:hypothetical protein
MMTGAGHHFREGVKLEEKEKPPFGKGGFGGISPMSRENG